MEGEQRNPVAYSNTMFAWHSEVSPKRSVHSIIMAHYIFALRAKTLSHLGIKASHI